MKIKKSLGNLKNLIMKTQIQNFQKKILMKIFRKTNKKIKKIPKKKNFTFFLRIFRSFQVVENLEKKKSKILDFHVVVFKVLQNNLT